VTRMLFGDAKGAVEKLVTELRSSVGQPPLNAAPPRDLDGL
jgi:hypothetical protein